MIVKHRTDLEIFMCELVGSKQYVNKLKRKSFILKDIGATFGPLKTLVIVNAGPPSPDLSRQTVPSG